MKGILEPWAFAGVFYSDFIGLRFSTWKQQKLILAHTGRKRIYWKDIQWLTDWKEKLLSIVFRRCSHQRSHDLGSRNLLGLNKHQHI